MNGSEDARYQSTAAAVELLRRAGRCGRIKLGPLPDERHLCQREDSHLAHCRCWCGHRWIHLTLVEVTGKR